MKAKQSLGSRIRGWLPNEPMLGANKIVNVTKKCKTEVAPQVYTRVGIANAVILGCFLVFLNFIEALNMGFVITVFSWILFGALILLVDVLIYRHSTIYVDTDGGN